MYELYCYDDDHTVYLFKMYRRHFRVNCSCEIARLKETKKRVEKSLLYFYRWLLCQSLTLEDNCVIIAATMIKCAAGILQQYLTVLANWILTGGGGTTLLVGGRLNAFPYFPPLQNFGSSASSWLSSHVGGRSCRNFKWGLRLRILIIIICLP